MGTIFLVYHIIAHTILPKMEQNGRQKKWGRMGIIYGQLSRGEKGKIGAEFVNAYLVPGEIGHRRIWPGY